MFWVTRWHHVLYINIIVYIYGRNEGLGEERTFGTHGTLMQASCDGTLTAVLNEVAASKSIVLETSKPAAATKPAAVDKGYPPEVNADARPPAANSAADDDGGDIKHLIYIYIYIYIYGPCQGPRVYSQMGLATNYIIM